MVTAGREPGIAISYEAREFGRLDYPPGHQRIFLKNS
jgi:hypothetical protein